MFTNLDEQIAIVKIDQNGGQFTKRAVRTIVNPETGDRVRREAPVRVRRWYWIDGTTGKAFVQIRYGNKSLEIAKGKSTKGGRRTA